MKQQLVDFVISFGLLCEHFLGKAASFLHHLGPGRYPDMTYEDITWSINVQYEPFWVMSLQKSKLCRG